MKLLRTIIIGTIIWIIGVSLYSLSFYISILKNAELQANIFLSLMVIPLVWFGAKLYYKKDSNIQGYWIGLAFFLTSAILDALVTVPYMILPNGGTYYDFFTDIGFWLIGVEFIITVVVYWYTKMYLKKTINL